MLRDRTLLSLCYSISLVLITGGLHAEVYRWIDDEGVVNYTQRKPANVDAIIVGKPASPRQPRNPTETPASSSSGQGNQESQLKLSEEQQEMYDALQQKEADRQIEISRIRASNCKRSKVLLQRLSANGRIHVRDTEGDERNLPDEERTQRIAEAQRGIVVNCEPD